MNPFDAPPNPSTSVVLPDPPRRRRWWMMFVTGAVVLAVTGGVILVATGGDDKPKYSLTASTDTAREVKSMSFVTTTEGFGNEVVAEIEIDVENGLMHFIMDLGSGVVGLGGEMEMIVDTDDEITYVHSSFFDLFGMTAPTEWLRMDAEWLVENGEDTVFNPKGVGNPLDAAVALENAVKTDEIGFDTVNDIKVKHYRVTFKSEDVFATNPQLESQLDELNGDIPDEFVYEFYIDEHNQLRRVTYTVDIGAGEVTTDIVVESINEPLQIDVPDEEDVTDARDFL